MLYCIASPLQTMLCRRRDANVRQLSLLETSLPQNYNDVWATLDDEQRTLVLGMLARLMARVIAARTDVNLAATMEESHE
jgi:hypothetical protein